MRLSTVAHYEIGEKLGGGGMGEVFAARDTLLRRTVAIKFLPPEWSRDAEAKERFLREAQAASALDHPNVCAVHDIGETDDGRLYLVMALCEGQSLSRRLAAGPLPVETALDIARQTLQGLGKAHEHGIIHRDIKPANLILSGDGVVKIVDFGLAKQAHRSRLTAHTATLGTAAYMSPEQARGDDVSIRSDLWSTGVVLYEMLTGRLPFDADYPQAAIYSILHREPEPPSAARPEVGPELDALVMRALSKEPGRRFASALEMRSEIDSLLGAGAPASERRGPRAAARTLPSPRTLIAVSALAVLLLTGALATRWLTGADRPRAAATGGARPRLGVLQPETPGHVGQGADWPALVQMLYAAELTGVSGIGVVDPLSLNGLLQSTLGDSRPERAPAMYEALREAKLAYLVDGSLLEHPGGYRLISNLVDAGTGELLFSRSSDFDREEELALTVRELSRQLLGFLQLEVEALASSADFEPWVSLNRQRVEAVKAFIQASRYIYRLEPGAERWLRRAIEADPSFIAPRIWLISMLDRERGAGEAAEHLRHLEGLEAGASPFEQAMIGWARAFLDGDRRAEARQLEIALDYSPGNNILLHNLATVRFELGEYAEAVAAIRPAVSMKWSYPAARVLLAASLVLQNEAGEAQKVLEEAVRLPAVDPEGYLLLEGLYMARGDRERARELGRTGEAALERSDGVGSWPEMAPAYRRLAQLCADQGRFEEAVALLERAVSRAPDRLEHRVALAEALVAAGEPSRATAECRRVLEAVPRQETCLAILARFAGGPATDAGARLDSGDTPRLIRLIDTHPGGLWQPASV